jgi:UDP-N-acetylglucosamine--N-acetylmuramyl-(pentapeptide) pyrophosphoryl-undecaprenol N-acetylglucosamine transferase
MTAARRVLFSGGGTAGHLYPALAVSRRLKERLPGIKVTFVGSSRKLEKNLMDFHQADFIPLNIEGLKGRGWKALRGLALLPFAFMKTLGILIRTRPHLSIGVGGYSSGPVVLLSAWLGIPTLILEQNALPGFTNRLLRRWVDKAVVSFPGTLEYFGDKGVLIGNPVREEFSLIPPKTRNRNLSVLVIGGSQGSHFLNRGITASLPALKGCRERLLFTHQTGEKDLEWVRQRYEEEGFSADVEAFFYDLSSTLAGADLVIARAGATTLAELAAARKASVLVPFARAADDHQTLNARELESVDGAEVITEKEFTPEVFACKIIHFINHNERLDQMEQNLRRLHKPGVAERITDLCFDLMAEKTRRG